MKMPTTIEIIRKSSQKKNNNSRRRKNILLYKLTKNAAPHFMALLHC